MGDVIENGQHVPLAERVWDELCGLVPFELVALEVDHYDESAKTTRVWGEERKGRATPKDRVIVLRRVPSRRTAVMRQSSRNVPNNSVGYCHPLSEETLL